MIRLVSSGYYRLIETKANTKILSLDGKNTFAWITADEIGEILITTHNPYSTDNILALGKYRIYDVKNEEKLTDLHHLELFVGEGKWQGYLLPTGLPNNKDKRKRIIPTNEIVTITTH